MNFSTARRSECLFDRFMEDGYSEYAAAAVVGNIYVESSGIDSGGPLPNTTGDPMLAWQATGAGCGLSTNLSSKESADAISLNCINVGIAQWGVQGPQYSSNPRVAGLIEYAQHQGQPWWDFLTQVGYIFAELGSDSVMANGTGIQVASYLRNCGTLHDCTYDFMFYYEGPSANSEQLRQFYAQLALNAWQGIPSYGLTCDLWAGWQHAGIVAGQ